jgi:hypothetical protein
MGFQSERRQAGRRGPASPSALLDTGSLAATPFRKITENPAQGNIPFAPTAPITRPGRRLAWQRSDGVRPAPGRVSGLRDILRPDGGGTPPRRFGRTREADFARAGDVYYRPPFAPPGSAGNRLFGHGGRRRTERRISRVLRPVPETGPCGDVVLGRRPPPPPPLQTLLLSFALTRWPLFAVSFGGPYPGPATGSAWRGLFASPGFMPIAQLSRAAVLHEEEPSPGKSGRALSPATWALWGSVRLEYHGHISTLSVSRSPSHRRTSIGGRSSSTWPPCR